MVNCHISKLLNEHKLISNYIMRLSAAASNETGNALAAMQYLSKVDFLRYLFMYQMVVCHKYL